MEEKYDFTGWATKNDIKCTDGRIIRRNAFKDDDGERVPLVWNHDSSTVSNILGHADLENREDGVYAYCKFNDTPDGQKAKMAVRNGDLNSLSIRAGRLKQNGASVVHGKIKELSLVLAGANSKARIENVLVHGDYGDYEDEEEANIRANYPIETYYSRNEEFEHADDDEKTVADVFNDMTEEQKKVCYFMITQALENQEAEHSDEYYEEGDDEDVKHNSFENTSYSGDTQLIHAEDVETIISMAKRGSGSLKEAMSKFAADHNMSTTELAHGMTNLELLFPEAHLVDNTPEFIKRDDAWVSDVMSSVTKTPFSRIKMLFADITEDEARARGYIKGKQKKEEIFSLFKRTTQPTTVYKLQKMDRDDMVDITTINVVNFLHTEMRMMLNEELARAILIGDGRSTASDDKIKEDCIRPVWTMEDLFTIKTVVPTATTSSSNARAKAFIRSVIKSRRQYKGSGNPVLYTTDDVITDCLLLEDNNGRMIYDTMEKLTTALRVSRIVAVPVMENQTRTDKDTNKKFDLMAIMVNLKDYKCGTDRGGEVTLFDDFDINFNKYEYLIETRMSGSLVKPKSAIVFEIDQSATPESVQAMTKEDIDNLFGKGESA